MKTFLILLAALTSIQTLAYPCPADLVQNKKKKSLHDWLSRIEGTHHIKGCSVEVTLCNPNEPPTDNQILAEVFVRARRQREAYLPITVAAKSDRKIQTQIQSYSRTLVYEKRDLYYEKELGREEFYQLEVVFKSPSSRDIEYLDLATYSTNKALNMPDGNQSRWYNCGSTAD
jgi:hypothetical protein